MELSFDSFTHQLSIYHNWNVFFAGVDLDIQVTLKKTRDKLLNFLTATSSPVEAQNWNAMKETFCRFPLNNHF